MLSGETLTKKPHLSWQILHTKSEQCKSSLQSQLILAVADPGGGGGGPGGSATPLFLDQTETRRAEKIVFGDRPPSFI